MQLSCLIIRVHPGYELHITFCTLLVNNKLTADILTIAT